MIPIAVAETDGIATKEGERYIMWLFNRGMKARPEFFLLLLAT